MDINSSEMADEFAVRLAFDQAETEMGGVDWKEATIGCFNMLTNICEQFRVPYWDLLDALQESGCSPAELAGDIFEKVLHHPLVINGTPSEWDTPGEN